MTEFNAKSDRPGEAARQALEAMRATLEQAPVIDRMSVMVAWARGELCSMCLRMPPSDSHHELCSACREFVAEGSTLARRTA